MSFVLRGLLAAVVVAVASPCAVAYSGGEGTAGNPYQIADVNDFMELTADPNNWDMAFILTNDIVFDPNNNRPCLYSGTHCSGYKYQLGFSGHTIYRHL